MNGAKKPNLWPLHIQLCVCVCLCSRMLGLTHVSQEGHDLTPSFKRKILGRVGGCWDGQTRDQQEAVAVRTKAVGTVNCCEAGQVGWKELGKERAMCVCVIAWVGGGGVGVQGNMIDWKAAAKNRQTEVNALNEINHAITDMN